MLHYSPAICSGIQTIFSLYDFYLSSSTLAREALCVIACQAYAEVNRWQEVIPFITQQFNGIEECPPKLVQLGFVFALVIIKFKCNQRGNDYEVGR